MLPSDWFEITTSEVTAAAAHTSRPRNAATGRSRAARPPRIGAIGGEVRDIGGGEVRDIGGGAVRDIGGGEVRDIGGRELEDIDGEVEDIDGAVGDIGAV